MATILFALPLKPGKAEALRAFTKAVVGERFAELDASERRIAIQTESWFLQKTPTGDLFTFLVESSDIAATFSGFISSTDPFDQWFKDQVRDLTGVDMNNIPPEMIAETLETYSSR